jgi:Lon protease-like protein
MDVMETLPMVPLRDVVVFPHMMIPFVIGRPSSIRALEYALVKGKRIFLSAQHDATRDNPGPEEIYALGTICNIVQSLKLPDGNVKVLVEGLERGRALDFKEESGFFKVVAKVIPRVAETGGGIEAVMSKAIALFEQYVKLSNNLHYDAMLAAVRVEDPGKLADTVASHLIIPVEEKQNLLEIFAPQERLTRIAGILEAEVDTLDSQKPEAHKPSPDRFDVAGSRELVAEGVVLQMFGTRLLVNGHPARVASSGAVKWLGELQVRGEVLWVEVPGRGRVFLSLAPRPGYDFKRSGLVSEDRILFALEGDLCEWISRNPIATSPPVDPFLDFLTWYVWVLHDPDYQRDVDGPGLGAGFDEGARARLKRP